MRIGALAREAGTTVRTVRYYEEIGLLPASEERSPGAHREYDEADVARVQELMRLKKLLGLSLDELREVMAGEDARAERRRAWSETSDPGQRAEMLDAAIAHTEALLGLVQRHRAEVEEFEAELRERRQRVRHLRGELVT
jgi:MerR family transcriptional regulator, repressor of the yfmOP operon